MKIKHISVTLLAMAMLSALLVFSLSGCKKDENPDVSADPNASEEANSSMGVTDPDESGEPLPSEEEPEPTVPVMPENPPAYMEDVAERIGTVYLNRPTHFHLIKKNLTNPVPVESGEGAGEDAEIPTPEEFYRTVIEDYNEALGYAFFDVETIVEVPYGIKVNTLSYVNKESGETEGPLQVWFECQPDDDTAARIAIVYAGPDGVYSYPGIQDSPEPEAYLDDNMTFLSFEAA